MSVNVRLKGLYHTWWTRADKSRVYYYYAWKGGPRIWSGEKLPIVIPPDHPVVEAFHEAHKNAEAQRPDGFVSGLIEQFERSTDFLAMAETTRYQWSRWLRRIDDRFGEMEIAALDDRGVRTEFKTWRDEYADRPRSADYAMQVLSRLLAYAKETGKIDFNRAAGIRRLSRSNQRAELIWTEEDIARAVAHPKTEPETALAIELAALCGLRRSDLIALRWDQIDDIEIVIPASKTRAERDARIPILAQTRLLLERIPQRSVCILTAPNGKPWKPSYLTQRVHAAAARANVDRKLHDLRGTFVTRLIIAGLSDAEIADITSWTVKAVSRMRRTYVSRRAVNKAIVVRLEAKK